MMWQIEVHNNNDTCDFKRNGGPTVSSDPLPIDEWEQVLVSYDGTTATIYRDGEAAASGPFSLGTGTGADLLFGREQADENAFNGSIDDVQLFNYPLDAKTVLDLYNANPAVDDKALCLDPYDAYFDVAGETGLGADCRINLYDLVEFTNTWLDCVLYPTAECN